MTVTLNIHIQYLHLQKQYVDLICNLIVIGCLLHGLYDSTDILTHKIFNFFNITHIESNFGLQTLSISSSSSSS